MVYAIARNCRACISLVVGLMYGAMTERFIKTKRSRYVFSTGDAITRIPCPAASVASTFVRSADIIPAYRQIGR
jgi:hypothetical protein